MYIQIFTMTKVWRKDTDLFENLIQLDHQVFKFINHDLATTVGDWFFPWITDAYKTLPFLTIVSLALIFEFRRSRPKSAQLVVALFLALTLSDGIAYRLVKPIVQRSRPEFSGIVVDLKTHSHSGFSFPSNHASNAASVATVLCVFYPMLAPIWIFLALLIALSRIYVGVHFPIDVIAGIALGCLSGYTAIYLKNVILRSKYVPKNVAGFFREQS